MKRSFFTTKWHYRHMPKINHRDNGDRLYDESNPNTKYWTGHGYENSFEQFLTEAVKEAYKEWLDCPFALNTDFDIMFNEDGSYMLDDTIWDKLECPDSKFYKRHKYNWRVRVPKLTRSDREWLNFYITFPWIAKDVITGVDRYSNGAKLKWIPLFTKVLESVWPKENQYKLTKEQLEHGIEAARFYKDDYFAYKTIGQKVAKYSGKPFKSHLWVNTVKGVDYMEVKSKGKTIKKVCYTFEEDDSIVAVDMCRVLNKEELE